LLVSAQCGDGKASQRSPDWGFELARHDPQPLKAASASIRVLKLRRSQVTTVNRATRMRASCEAEIKRFLRTGEYDPLARVWPGSNFLEMTRNGDVALRQALIAEIHNRTPSGKVPAQLADMDVVTLTRAKVAPMVQGLFSAAEQDAVLDMLGASVVFLTPGSIDGVIAQTPCLDTAWKLANLYLAGYDAPLLADDAPSLVGLSEGTTCYVSMAYFTECGRFDDFVVHEAAHVFHNCKRATLGLRGTRRREWLLDIAFAKRETFAYACEAYSRIQALGDNPRLRNRLLAEHEAGWRPMDERVDGDEYVDILSEAVSARNGWKRILARCSPPSPRRARDGVG
jgi:hypothetical protein